MNWIPVTERLPEVIYAIGFSNIYSEEVLAYSKDDDCFLAHYEYIDGDKNNAIWVDLCDDNVISDITYWMPLPKPPDETP